MVTGLVPYFAVIPPMDRIIEAIEAEIQRLHAARTLLAGETIARKVGKPGPGKRSAATRAKMSEAQDGRGGEGEGGEVMDDGTWTSGKMRAPVFFGSPPERMRQEALWW
jgi:hypothetical protein